MPVPTLLYLAALGFFWIGMLGLLWRRSLIGMLVGVLFGWLSVVLGATAWLRAAAPSASSEEGASIVFCVVLVAAIQAVLGLSIVVSRVARSGSLDAEDAGLLEG